MDVRIVRIFNTYGPRMIPNDGRVVSNFIVQALKGNSLTIYGDGTQTRSFCYVDDLIEGFIKLMNSEYSSPVNLGNPAEFKIIELAEKVRDLIDPNLQSINKPLPGDDPLQRKPVIDLAKAELSWEPKVPLSEGLIKTINYFKEVL